MAAFLQRMSCIVAKLTLENAITQKSHRMGIFSIFGCMGEDISVIPLLFMAPVLYANLSSLSPSTNQSPRIDLKEIIMRPKNCPQ